MPSSTLYDATLGGLTLKQVDNATFSSNITVVGARGSANPAIDEFYISQGRPTASFTTRDIAGAFGSLSTTAGLYVSSGTFDIPYRVRSAGGGFASGTSHYTIDATDGLVVPTTLSVSGTGVATLGVDVHFESTDGYTAPTGVSSGVTIGSDADYNACYRAYTPSINGSSVVGVTSISVNFGLTVIDNLGQSGYLYPTEFYIPEYNPTIDLTFQNIAAVDTFGSLFSAQSACIIKLQKHAAGGTVVATATGEHVTFTGSTGIVEVVQTSASGTDHAEVTLRLHCSALTVSTTATL